MTTRFAKPEAPPRPLLTDFLKNCRRRLAPGDVGLPSVPRGRTQGLRREDVAAIAGVSVTWYTWLEQGRSISPSTRVLETLSRTLKLSPDERDYLFALAQNRAPPLVPAIAAELAPSVQRALARLTVPALIMTMRWDVVAWNWLTAQLFRDYAALPPEERNLMRILLTHPAYQEDPAEFEEMARRLLAKLRLDYSQSGGDPAFDTLIEQLTAESPVFRRLWRSPEIAGRAEGTNVTRHPHLGGMVFEHTSYLVEGAPGLHLMLFVPHDAATDARLSQIAAERPAFAEE